MPFCYPYYFQDYHDIAGQRGKKRKRKKEKGLKKDTNGMKAFRKGSLR